MKWLLILTSLVVLSSCAHGGKWGKMDSNGDGQVTRAEFDAHTDAKFKKHDKDGNGTIDAAEMPKKKCCKKKCGDKKQCDMKKGQCDMNKKAKKCDKCGKPVSKTKKKGSCLDGQCQLRR